jgi:hypothetical protein
MSPGQRPVLPPGVVVLNLEDVSRLPCSSLIRLSWTDLDARPRLLPVVLSCERRVRIDHPNISPTIPSQALQLVKPDR